MIKTAIKHFILEACIDQFFKGIDKNFRKCTHFKPIVGKIYSHVKYREVICGYGINIHLKNVMASKIFINIHNDIKVIFHNDGGKSFGCSCIPMKYIYYLE